jgi:Spy/CpxP family protein refolding chaperone
MIKNWFAGALVAALVVPTVSSAQTLPGAAQQREAATHARAHHGVPFLRMREELQLTPQQVAQLEAIGARLQEQNRPLMEQMRTARGGDERVARRGDAARGQRMTPEQREQMRARMEQMTPEQRQQMHAQMREMTPEQREQMRARMEQMTPEQRQQMHAQMREMTPEQRQQMHAQMREMTPEQRAEMRARHQGQRPQGVRGGANVPTELQPVVAQMRQNGAAAMQAARGVLTPQQLERAEQLMRERTSRRGERAPAAHRGHR